MSQFIFNTILTHADAIKRNLTVSSLAQVSRDWKSYALSCVQPGLDYFVNHFTRVLSSQLDAFKAAWLLCQVKLFICLRIPLRFPQIISIFEMWLSFSWLESWATILPCTCIRCDCWDGYSSLVETAMPRATELGICSTPSLTYSTLISRGWMCLFPPC